MEGSLCRYAPSRPTQHLSGDTLGEQEAAAASRIPCWNHKTRMHLCDNLAQKRTPKRKPRKEETTNNMSNVIPTKLLALRALVAPFQGIRTGSLTLTQLPFAQKYCCFRSVWGTWASVNDATLTDHASGGFMPCPKDQEI